MNFVRVESTSKLSVVELCRYYIRSYWVLKEKRSVNMKYYLTFMYLSILNMMYSKVKNVMDSCNMAYFTSSFKRFKIFRFSREQSDRKLPLLFVSCYVRPAETGQRLTESFVKLAL